MKTWIKYLIALIVIALLAVLFYKKVYIPKTTYQTLTPSLGSLHVSITGIGNVNAKDIYTITAQTGGKILKIDTDIGMWVKKGELLVEMDGVDLPQQLEIAEANLKKADFEITASIAELQNQKAQKSLIQITYQRYERLKIQGYTSQSEYDKAKTDLEGIDAAIDATVSRIDATKASSVIAQKSIDAIKTKIDRLKVYSPIDGFVISKDAQIAQSVLPSTPIVKIFDPKTLWVEAKIDERISSAIKVAQSATITLRSQPNKSYKAVVKRVNSMSDAVTLEREIDVGFMNTPKPFYINEQAEVSIHIKTYTNVVKIPSKVVVQNGGKLGVWIVENSHAKFIFIDKIAQDDNEVAIKNLDKNSKILVPSANKKPLKDGMKIHL